MAPGDLVDIRYSWCIQLTTGRFQPEIPSDRTRWLHDCHAEVILVSIDWDWKQPETACTKRGTEISGAV